MEKKTEKFEDGKKQEKSSGRVQLRHTKIPEDGICCPFCKSKKFQTVVPMNCCLPTREVCDDCGKDFVIEDDEILYFGVK